MRESAKSASAEARELVEAVQQLTIVVGNLNTLLEQDYPKREEIERNYATRAHIRNRRIVFAVATVSAIVISYFLAVSTVVYCFHNGAPGDRYRPVCAVFPGYEVAQGGNNEIIGEFENLQEQVEENTDLLNEINDTLGGQGRGNGPRN